MGTIPRLGCALLLTVATACWCNPPAVTCETDDACPDGFRCASATGQCVRQSDADRDAAILDAIVERSADRDPGDATAGEGAGGDAMADAAPTDAAPTDAAVPDAATTDLAATEGGAPDALLPDVSTADGAAGDGALPDAAQSDSAQVDTARPDSAQVDTTQPDTARPDTAQPDTAQVDAARPDVCTPDCSAACTAMPDGCGGTCPDPCDSCTSNGCDTNSGAYRCHCLPGYVWSGASRACEYVDDGALALASGETFDLASSGVHRNHGCADGPSYTVARIDGDLVTVEGAPGCCLLRRHEVLLINLQGAPGATSNVGFHEVFVVTAVNGSEITLSRRPARNYGASALGNDNIGIGDGQQRVALVRIPRYSDVVVPSNAVLTSEGWDGYKGGVLALRSESTVTVAGTITMTGAGYRGGRLITDGQSGPAEQGESYRGPGVFSSSNNGGGGGAGCYDSSSNCASSGGGGAGRSAGEGTSSDTCTSLLVCSSSVAGGSAYAIADLSTKIFLGSGGGGSAFNSSASCSSGGAGGGMIILDAAGAIQVNAPSYAGIHADGKYADGSDNVVGGGGGGGSILLRGTTVGLGSFVVTAIGGLGAVGGSGSGAAGGNGVVWINAASVMGESLPPHNQ